MVAAGPVLQILPFPAGVGNLAFLILLAGLAALIGLLARALRRAARAAREQQAAEAAVRHARIELEVRLAKSHAEVEALGARLRASDTQLAAIQQQLRFKDAPSYGPEITTRGDYGETLEVQGYAPAPAGSERRAAVPRARAARADHRRADSGTHAGGLAVAEQKFSIRDVFLIYQDGRLMCHLTRKVRIIDDSQIIAGMISAVQMFVRDCFRREAQGSLDEVRFGALRIVAATGPSATLAVVVEGKPPKEYRRRMRTALEEVHTIHAAIINDWNGDLRALGSEEKVLRRMLLEPYDSEEFHRPGRGTFSLEDAPVQDHHGAPVFRVGLPPGGDA